MKKNIERFLYFLVYSNIYLALGALSIAYMSIVLLQVPFRLEPLFIAFSGTFFLYNLNRKTDIEEDKINYPERVEFLEKYGKIFFRIGIVLYISSLLLALWNNFITFIIVLIPFILVLIHSVLRMKKHLMIKDTIVPLGWCMIPLLASSYYQFLLTSFILVFFIFSRSFIITIYYDIKDILGDKIQKIKTIPNIYGIKFTINFLIAVNLLFFLIFITTSFTFPPTFFILLTSITIYCFIYLLLEKKFRKPIIYEVLSSGEYLLLGALAIVIGWL